MTTTADIGLHIRDMIEDTALFGTGDVNEPTDSVDVVCVDDPHNPRIIMASGAVFIVRIVQEG